VQNGAGLKVRVASGVSLATLARRMASSGFGGIEWACGIPGSIGGAVVSNAGAYDVSLKDILKSVRVGDADGKVATLPAAELHLEYRTSAFTEGEIEDLVLLSADIRVDEANADELKQKVREYDEDRKASQPPGQNCGSVFKNPADHPSWWYVDQVGLRGHRIGNAQFSELHTNFILNLGGATAHDIVQLIELAEERIEEQFEVDLEREVALIGEFE
jgi:UDP-N-acetylmuramate dehydrogenase